MKASRTITLLAVLASLIVATPVATAAAPSAPAEEEYVLELPSAGSGADSGAEGGRSADEPDRGPAGRSADSGTLSTITADASDGGPAILLVILAATALAGISIAIVKAAK